MGAHSRLTRLGWGVVLLLLVALVLLLVALPLAVFADSFAHNDVPLSTCLSVTGNVSPLFMASGTCVDVAEANVEQPLKTPGTFVNLQCTAKQDFGAGTITLTGRAGACGALADQAFTCVLTGGSGRPTCSSGSGRLAVAAAGNCYAVRLAFSGPITPTYVNCTMERAL